MFRTPNLLMLLVFYQGFYLPLQPVPNVQICVHIFFHFFFGIVYLIQISTLSPVTTP